MIRRDYILRMIEEFVRALARIREAKQARRWEDAQHTLEDEFRRLAGCTSAEAAQLTETDLLARLMQGESTHTVRDKALLVTSLLHEAGDVATGQGNLTHANACYLKALDFLLSLLNRPEDTELPAFVPTVEVYLAALKDMPLPTKTRVMLMEHFERVGEFAKAEDWLFTLIDDDPQNPAVLEFGAVFYQRLTRQPDDRLARGNLARAEVMEGLAELQKRINK